MKTTCRMPFGLSERGGESLNTDVLDMQSWGLRCIRKSHHWSSACTIVLRVLQSGLAGHPVTKPKPLEEWTWSVHLLYDCLFTFIQCDVALQCRGGKDGILLVQLQKQLDEVCHNHTLSKHTSITTSQIRFAYDKFTYIFNINVYLNCNGMILKEGTKDALGLIGGDYPESSNLPNSDMLSRRSVGPTWGPTWYWNSGSAK